MICNWNMQLIAYKCWFVNKDSHFYLIEYAIRWRLYQIILFTWYKTNRMNRFPPFFAPYNMEKFCDILFRSTSYSENSGFFGILVSLEVWCLFPFTLRYDQRGCSSFFFSQIWNIFHHCQHSNIYYYAAVTETVQSPN